VYRCVGLARERREFRGRWTAPGDSDAAAIPLATAPESAARRR